MRGKTHIAAGAAVGLFISTKMHLSLSDTMAVTAVSTLGGLTPDIDNVTSKLGRLCAPASLLIQLIIGHRTLFHAPLLYVILAYVVTGLYPSHQLLILSCTAGIATHLLLDLCNPAGIPLFWPIRKRIHLLPFRSGGLVDRILGLGFSLLAVVLTFSIIAALLR